MLGGVNIRPSELGEINFLDKVPHSYPAISVQENFGGCI